jgi:pilus assembly protein CpaE
MQPNVPETSLLLLGYTLDWPETVGHPSYSRSRPGRIIPPKFRRDAIPPATFCRYNPRVAGGRLAGRHSIAIRSRPLKNLMLQKTFTVAVISPQQQIREQLTSVFEQNPQLEGLWTLADYPGPAQLARIRETRYGCVVFLDFSDAIRAGQVALELDQNYPKASTVAIQAAASPLNLIELIQLGIRDVISVPVSEREADEAFQRASRKLGRETESEGQRGDVYAFLPARPGSGATTIAAHSAAAAARLSGERTLLIDFDLRLGMTSFLFKLHSQHSIVDALALSDKLEDTLWDQLVSRCGGLDILGSAPVEFDREVSSGGSAVVIESARRRYRTICVDLPGEMRPHELETLDCAKEIFLVCTSELGTLHMAKKKADMLQSLGVQSRVSVIVNRAQPRGSMVLRDIEEVLHLPVRFTLPPAEAEILAATQKAVALEGNSPIARLMENIARRMIGKTEVLAPEVLAPKTTPRRLIEFFSVSPVRDKVRKG